GVNHDLANGWGFNAYYQRGKSHKHMILDNLLRVDRWFLAQDAVRDPATGNIVCNVQLYNPTPTQLAESVQNVLVPSPQGPVNIASPIGLDNTIAGCVPLNIFGWGNASQEARDYVVTDKWAESYITQDFAEAVLTGELLENRRAGSIGFSVGATYRKEDLYQAAYPRDIDDLGPPVNRPELGIRGIPNGFELGTPDLHQFSTLTTFGGSFDVWETFAEVLVPLYDNGTQRLDWNVAARYADYSLSGGVVAWKAGLDFQATEDLRIRATLSRDVREATFAERFDQQAGGATINDPILEGRAFSTNILSGGNPSVAPEEADTYVLGIVYEPSWLAGTALSLDYYDIDLTGAIGRLGVQRIVDDCFAGDMAMCPRIERHPSTNEITLVSDIYTNIDGAKTRGVDLEVSYRTEPDFFSNISENLSIRMLAGYLAERSETPLGGITTEFAGSGVSPEWTTTTTLNYSLGAWDLSLTHRFIDSVKREVNWVEGVDVDINKVEAVRWMNMRLAYTHELDRGSWEAFGSITNLFDEHPPMYASNISRGLPGNFSALHHTLALGRNYVVGLRYEF
ncbi:MAG TPA: TonB-dependent receptor, partial [Hyphomicrobiales bacterium]|nr:TonB-dependent receptor [Hyphomicrobiales bacterium]